jgi:pimeloyl-ACP methyl ester carboxylesterase
MAKTTTCPGRKGNTDMDARPNIVLVHGAWADGSCWSGVIERLQADDYHVTAPQFPARPRQHQPGTCGSRPGADEDEQLMADTGECHRSDQRVTSPADYHGAV